MQEPESTEPIINLNVRSQEMQMSRIEQILEQQQLMMAKLFEENKELRQRTQISVQERSNRSMVTPVKANHFKVPNS